MKTTSTIANKSIYQDQLRSPEWAARSLKKRQDQPYCSYCKRGNVSLNVHHIFYDWDRNLWEYDDSELVVCCEVCHEAMTKELQSFRKHVFGKLTPQSMKALNAALAVALEQYDALTFCRAMCEFVGNPRLVENHSNAWDKQSVVPDFKAKV